MAIVTGSIGDITGEPGIGTVTIVPSKRAGTVVTRGKMIVPRVMQADSAADGTWQAKLAEGYYDVSSGGAARTISVPDDDASHAFETLLVDAVPGPAPSGWAAAAASTSAQGIVKADTNDADPVAVTGIYFCADVAALRTQPVKAYNKLGIAVQSSKLYAWDGTSVAADDGAAVLKPDALDSGDPGRWTIWDIGAVPVPNLAGDGNPNGVVTAPEGTRYWDRTGKADYVKDAGTGNTGWRELIALT